MSALPSLNVRRQQERVAIFIDGSNLFASAKALGMDINYSELLSYFERTSYVVRAYYYTAVDDRQDLVKIRPLLDYLNHHGFTVVEKSVRVFTNERGEEKIKGNMDIEMTLDVIEIAERVDHVILFTGDEDFVALVRAVQRRAVRVTVVSTRETKPYPMIGEGLRKAADKFIELNEEKFREILCRPRE